MKLLKPEVAKTVSQDDILNCIYMHKIDIKVAQPLEPKARADSALNWAVKKLAA